MLECPECRKYAVAVLAPDRITVDPATHGCTACGFKLRVFFCDAKAAEFFARTCIIAKTSNAVH